MKYNNSNMEEKVFRKVSEVFSQMVWQKFWNEGWNLSREPKLHANHAA